MKESLQKKIPFILAHWHGDELVLLKLIMRYRVATIASTSVDGDLMNQLIHFAGGVTSRGSSTRGGVSALKGLIKLVRNGRCCSFSVDGPKGPLHEVKPGVFELSRLLACPIYSAGVSCDRAWIFEKSWNKMYLPKPFARIVVNWGGPMDQVTKEQDPRSPELAEKLKNALHYSHQVAIKKNFAALS
jgi:lysophospholipid acyltransferase (LPLAT)-like uncharacterized protein